jgi:hypothetical protein
MHFQALTHAGRALIAIEKIAKCERRGRPSKIRLPDIVTGCFFATNPRFAATPIGCRPQNKPARGKIAFPKVNPPSSRAAAFMRFERRERQKNVRICVQ